MARITILSDGLEEGMDTTYFRPASWILNIGIFKTSNDSFCTLTAHFAVEVYGAPLYAGYQAAIVIGMMIVVVSILAVSYYIQRSKLAKKQKNE